MDEGQERALSIFEKMKFQMRTKWGVGAIIMGVNGDPYLRTQRAIIVEATLLLSLAVASSAARMASIHINR